MGGTGLLPFGVVLAGGASRRMGRDKARLVIQGQALVERVARRLDEVCAEVVIASGDGQRLRDLSWPQVADEVAGVGPLGGILAGLAHARHGDVAVVAVDLPFVDGMVLRALRQRAPRGALVVAPRHAGRLQPLHALWHRDAHDRLAGLVADGVRRVGEAFDALGGRPVDVDDLDPAGHFSHNVNRPDDLDRLGLRP